MIRKSQSLLFRQRILIAGLAVALSTGLASSAQAGVIPWVFEVIFGPVHRSVPYSPGPVYSYPAAQPQVGYTYRVQSYPSTYSYAGYNGFGCAPCRPSPCQCNPCATARCAVGTVAPSKTPTTTIAFYHPVYGWVSQSCPTDKPVQTATKTDDVSSGTGDVGSKAPEPKKTYAVEIDPETGKKKDPFKPKPTTSVKKQVTSRNAAGNANNSTENKADTPTNPDGDAGTTTTTTTSSDDADAKATGDAKSTDADKKPDPGFGEGERKGKFVDPIKLGEKAEEKKAGEKTDAIKIDDLKKGSDLDNKSSWLVPTLDVKRVAFRPGFRNARLARRAELINVDFVIPSTGATRIVSK